MLFFDGEGLLQVAPLFLPYDPAFLEIWVRVFELLFAVLDRFMLSAHSFFYCLDIIIDNR